ncbi:MULTISPECIES: class I SAM-dependent methyltransferase [Cyanophyceae]|uniref:Class I SAM-dependent methyltransferase n=1 Tax=Leptolyngbya subtilissima DQ-A4 TaxID=2933933 RepID=A0ABV0K6F0_9CYAN|nr:class I SAM-dependent methyltransferase [Nodosilinea sp. FACHB-141]MBD2114428.1 class I SAM-dependent methyltransferase [Nodosilinea sp. FACHB-141]
MEDLYTIENALQFKWASVTGSLNPERVSHLKSYVIGKKILDVGCGGGAYVEFLSQQGFDITGVDKHKQFLQLAQEESAAGTYVQGDIAKLPFPDKTFDSSYCFDVLEHVDDKLAIKELARVTANRIIIAVPKEDEIMNKYNLTFLHYQDKTHLRNYTEDSLKKLASSINPSNIHIFTELGIPTRSLVKEMIEFKETQHDNSPKKAYRKMLNFLLQKLLNRTYYKEVYTGLVAVIDI